MSSLIFGGSLRSPAVTWSPTSEVRDVVLDLLGKRVCGPEDRDAMQHDVHDRAAVLYAGRDAGRHERKRCRDLFGGADALKVGVDDRGG